MKQSVFLRAVLVLSGLIGFSVGFGQLFLPISFEASAGIRLGTDPALLSEIRGAGGSLLLSGILMIYGAFKPSFTRYALLLSIVLYLSYGVSRMYGFAVDGVPNQSFLIVTITEMVLGVISWVLYHRSK
ncbi:hypothetical protein D3C87_65080 [compost metagenome]